MAIIVSTSIDPRTLPDLASSGPQPPDDAEPSSPAVSARITSAFSAAYARYEAALGQTLDLVNLEDTSVSRSSFPEIEVTFDADESPTAVVFDADLLATLIETYALQGWGGVRLIEQLLSTRWNESAGGQTSGGTTLSAWAAVVPFFKTTRNLLAKLVRDTLADIERQARARIESRLRLTDKAFERVWTSELRIGIASRTEYRQAGKERIPFTVNEFVFGNRPLADDVFVDLTHAVKARAAVERRLEQAREDADRTAARQSQDQRDTQSRGAGYRSPYAKETTREDVDEKQRQQASVEAELVDLLSVIEASFIQNCPVALLVFPGLRPAFTQPEMEHAIGVALESLRMRCRKLTAVLSKADNRVELLFPDDPAKPLGDFGNASSAGIETTLLDQLLVTADDDAVLPLLSDDTWHEMVAVDAIPRGGFSYFVYFHYLNELMARRERAARQAQRDDPGKVLNTSLAVVSLATLFLPVLAPLEVALGIFSIFHGIDAAASQLAAIDSRLKGLLSQPEGSAASVFGRVGELEVMRREVVVTTARDLLLGLVAQTVGAQWQLTKQLLFGYGYYTDLATLYGGLRGESEG